MVGVRTGAVLVLVAAIVPVAVGEPPTVFVGVGGVGPRLVLVAVAVAPPTVRVAVLVSVLTTVAVDVAPCVAVEVGGRAVAVFVATEVAVPVTVDVAVAAATVTVPLLQSTPTGSPSGLPAAGSEQGSGNDPVAAAAISMSQEYSTDPLGIGVRFCSEITTARTLVQSTPGVQPIGWNTTSRSLFVALMVQRGMPSPSAAMRAWGLKPMSF